MKRIIAVLLAAALLCGTGALAEYTALEPDGYVATGGRISDRQTYAGSWQKAYLQILDNHSGLIHAYQKRGEFRRISDRNIGAVLFSPVRFLAMNRAGMFCGGDACGEAEAEAELRELVQLLQELLTV